MKLRRNILPRRIVDILCFLLIAIFLPIVYIFEMAVVLPAFHSPDGFFYCFTFIAGVFIIYNITGNMIACMSVDTSVDFQTVKPPQKGKEFWRFCDACQKYAPPRSWHCQVCRVCILKRDHHCLFTGCCIGHKNHRYFIMFVVYMFFGSLYAFMYNSVYLFVLNSKKFWNLMSLLKIVCPAFNLVTGSIWQEQNSYLIFYSLNIFAVCYSALLLFYHGQTVLEGGVCYERDKGYPFKAHWKQNLRCVLGKRMHVAWLSPLIASELPNNGIEWRNKSRKRK